MKHKMSGKSQFHPSNQINHWCFRLSIALSKGAKLHSAIEISALAEQHGLL
jgi:hypothetical protein